MSWLPDCHEVQAHLTDLEEGVLPLRQRLAYRLHLLYCKYCAAALRGMRSLPRLAKALLSDEGRLSTEQQDRILERLKQRLGQDPGGPA